MLECMHSLPLGTRFLDRITIQEQVNRDIRFYMKNLLAQGGKILTYLARFHNQLH